MFWMSVHCCERMDRDLNRSCAEHESPYDCPDALIDLVRGRYGLIVHDGGPSVIEINFCPWCGVNLSKTPESIPTIEEMIREDRNR
jgi:hypothetical protein